MHSSPIEYLTSDMPRGSLEVEGEYSSLENKIGRWLFFKSYPVAEGLVKDHNSKESFSHMGEKLMVTGAELSSSTSTKETFKFVP